MRHLFVLLTLFFGVSVSFGNAQSDKDLFPEIDGWKISGEIRVYNPANLWDYINGAADTYLQYNFKELHVAQYHKDEDTYITAEIYRHETPDHAFGMYKLERPEDIETIKTGTEGYQIESILNFYSGKYYVKIQSHKETDVIKKTIRDIAGKIAENLSTKENAPAVVSYFPDEENKIDNSTQFISDNFLGHEFLHSAYTTKYMHGKKELMLFIIALENPKQCKSMLKEYIKFAGYKPRWPIKQKYYEISDKYNGRVSLFWRDNYLFGALNIDNTDIRHKYAKKLEKSIMEKGAFKEDE